MARQPVGAIVIQTKEFSVRARTGSLGGHKVKALYNIAYVASNRTRTGRRFGEQRQTTANSGVWPILLVGSLALGSILFVTPAKITGYDHERVWLGDRGPFSLKRAIAFGPTLCCLSTGIIATVVAARMPHRARAMARELGAGASLHDLLALPLSLLLAFRFQSSFDRWIHSYQELENFNSKIITLACMCLALDEQGPSQLAVTIHLLALLDAWCWLAEKDFMRGDPPHPNNDPGEWKRPLMEFKTYEGAHELVCCQGELVRDIRRAQRLEVFTPEFSSEMVDLVAQIHDHYQGAMFVNRSQTPAPLVVHMRTFLLLFVSTYPLTLIGRVKPLLIIPAQLCISFSLLGIEFCCREMEQPFGDDESDIPVRRLMSRIRDHIRILHDNYAQMINASLKDESILSQGSSAMEKLRHGVASGFHYVHDVATALEHGRFFRRNTSGEKEVVQ